MTKKALTSLCVALILLNPLGVIASKYVPPYEAVNGGRLEESMPVPFSFDTSEKKLEAACNFNASYNSASLIGGNADKWSSTDGAIKLEKFKTGGVMDYILTYSGDFEKGDIYVFRCTISTKDVSGGAPRTIICARSAEHANLVETHGYDGKSEITGTNEAYTMTQIMKIPDNTDYLQLRAYLAGGVTGTVYFDDFELYKLGLDPLESVLVSPSYKGLIYGDGYSDIVLDAVVSADGEFYIREDMYLEVSLTDEYGDVIYSSVADELAEKMNFVFSSQGLPEGDYYLKTVLKDKSNDDVISAKEHTVRKRDASYRPSAYVDENGHYIKDGDKRFISRIYNHSGYDNSDDYLEVAQEANAMGIDTVSNYGMWWYLSNPIEDALSYMRNNSMTTHICLSSYWFSDRSGNMGTSLIHKQSDILPLFTRIANDYKNEPALEGYYVFDEPDPLIVGEEIRWNNEILAEADIDHPTFGVADKSFDEYGIYVKMTDILGIDPYPVTGNTDKNGVSTDNIATVGRRVREIKNNFPNRPVYYVLQGFHYESRGDLRSPTYDELRNMAWQAICEGAEGLDWYAYPEMTADETKDFDTWKQEVSTLMSEVESYEDIIMSDEPAPLYSVSGGGDWLNLCVRRFNGKTYLFAVNNTHTNNSATVNIRGLGDTELSFGPLEVVIREFNQEEFLSPEAELISMGFGNGTEIFETSENEVILYVSEDSGVINYTAKISDGASLEIGGKTVPLTGKITVRKADTFTVKVRAENGYSTTSVRYHVVRG